MYPETWQSCGASRSLCVGASAASDVTLTVHDTVQILKYSTLSHRRRIRAACTSTCFFLLLASCFLVYSWRVATPTPRVSVNVCVGSLPTIHVPQDTEPV
jgi:hypothetical protein